MGTFYAVYLAIFFFVFMPFFVFCFLGETDSNNKHNDVNNEKKE